MRLKIILIGIAIFFSGILYAQQIRLVSGNLDFLIGQSKIRTEYDYEDMGVGKYENESEYIAEIVKNNNEDKPGSGEEWKKGWFSDRPERFHPSFELALNKKVKKKGLIFGSIFEDAQYTLLMKFIRIEPGYNYFAAAAIANISVYIIFIETNNPEKEMAKIVIPLCPGTARGRIADRLESAYSKCGKEFGEYLIEKAYVK